MTKPKLLSREKVKMTTLDYLLSRMPYTLHGLVDLLDPGHSEGPADPAVLSHCPRSFCHATLAIIAPALDVASKHVIEAEERCCEKEEAGGEVIMEPKGNIVNFYISLRSGLEKAGKTNHCPKDVHHARRKCN